MSDTKRDMQTRGSALASIESERLRQIEDEGYDAEHDDEHGDGELAMAAACYAAPRPIFRLGISDRFAGGGRGNGRRNTGLEPETVHFTDFWPFDTKWDKRHLHSRERQLVIAGAFLLAELERLERAKAAEAAETP